MGIFSKKSHGTALTANSVCPPSVQLPPAIAPAHTITIHNNGNQPLNVAGPGGGRGAYNGPWHLGSGSQNIMMGTSSVMQPARLQEERIAFEYFHIFINKIYSDKSTEFKNQIFDLYKNKTFDEIHKAISTIFSGDGLDFLKEMTDEEIINYLKITV